MGSEGDRTSERDVAPDDRTTVGTPPDEGSGDAAEPTRAPRVDGREALLEVKNVTLRFGGVVALDKVDFTLYEGEILGLIGPNGAGKTTCFNAMTGVYRPTEGEILFDGQTLSDKKRFKITKMRLARTFQNIRLFPEMTAMENVAVGADAHHKTSIPSALFRLPRHWREERDGRQFGQELLDFVGITARSDELARNLPYGDQRR